MIKKKTLTIIGAAALALACTAGATAITASADTAPVVQDYASFSMLDGASVRLKKDEKAIRFTTKILRTELNEAVGIVAGDDEATVNEKLATAQIVTMVTPTRYLDAAGKTDFVAEDDLNGTEEGNGIQSIEIRATNYAKDEDNIIEIDGSVAKKDYYYFNACLYDVEEANLSRKFSAKSYLLIGDTIVDYTAFDYEKNSRDIWDVANQAKNSGDHKDTESTDEPYDYLAALSKTFDVTVGDYTKNVKRGERLAWYADEIKDNLDKEDADNLTYSYYRGLVDYDDTQSVTSDLTLTAKYDVINFADNGDGTYAVSTGHTLNAGAEIVIPETFNGGSITSVAGEAFNENTNLVSIVLPDTVTSLGQKSFRKCTNLTQIVAPGATGEHWNTAYGANKLSKLVVGNGFTFKSSNWVTENAPAGQLDLYVHLKSGEAFDVTPINTATMLSWKVYLYSETEKAGAYSYDQVGNAVAYNNGSYYDWSLSGFTGLHVMGNVFNFTVNPDGTTCALNGLDANKVINTYSLYVKVPETLSDGEKSYTVTSVASNAFNIHASNGGYCGTAWKLEEMILPETVTSIGAQAFRYCEEMTYFEARGITGSIASTHYGCDGLEKVVLGNGATLGKDFTNKGSYIAYFDVYLDVASIDQASFKVTDGVNSEPEKDGTLFSGRVYLYSETEALGCFHYENGYAVAYNVDSYYTYDVETDTLVSPTA